MNKEVLEAKKQQVEDIKAKISSAKSIVIVDYMGLRSLKIRLSVRNSEKTVWITQF